jgi:hypothetical protein
MKSETPRGVGRGRPAEERRKPPRRISTLGVRQRLLDEEDGPMPDVLKGFQGQPIELPRRKTWQPDRDLLASRFETFSGAA